MQDLDCASCKFPTLKAAHLVGGVWYALCTTCLFETEIEVLDGNAGSGPGYRVKGVAGLSAQQEGDMRRPAAATSTDAHR